MNGLLGVLGTGFDLLLVVLGFGLVVFIHELGHFVAARWAGIRVLAFAIGFGPALCSYRKGLGWRRGSSTKEHEELVKASAGGQEPASERVSPTEYRINALPFGGYVKMLGQEDLDPGAVSAAPDSYQSAKPWKRMIVISAGVVMNVVLAAFLFIIVFLVGLDVEPAKIGSVAPGSPADTAVALNADELGVDEAGLRPGDVVTRSNDRPPNSFQDLVLASAMGGPKRPVRFEVERAGFSEPLRFRITPERGRLSGLYEIGITPFRSARLFDVESEAEQELLGERLAEIGAGGVEPGMTLARIDGFEVERGAHQLVEAARDSGGEPLALEFESDDGRTVEVSMSPEPELRTDLVQAPGDEDVVALEHVLGLTPVLRVGEAQDKSHKQGLRDGDVFVRLGSVEYPSIVQGIMEIRANRGRVVSAVVLREDDAGDVREVPLKLRVSSAGQVGFWVSDTARSSTLLARPPTTLQTIEGEEYEPAARTLIDHPGARIREVAGEAVETLAEARMVLDRATRGEQAPVTVDVVVELPLRDEQGEAITTLEEWTLDEGALSRLRELAWTSSFPLGLFAPEQKELKAEGPFHAVWMGVEETHRVMMTTYATFERLFAGTVKVEHLKGPVGIAHVGTRIASKGFIWLLFFLAIISVNLAVINFLPLPIVDGGQFLMIVWEQVRGRPMPIPVQNAITLAGLVLIGTLFVIVTFNDVRGLLGG